MPESGYSGTPLEKKLGLKAGMNAAFTGLPENLAFLAKFDGLRAVVFELPEPPRSNFEFIHLFETSRASLESRATQLLSSIASDGMIWISWPKKASKVPTSLTEDILREIFLPRGLVDVKVCAVDQTWSGLKFVIRKELRKPAL
jgi:hypothetical protein